MAALAQDPCGEADVRALGAALEAPGAPSVLASLPTSEQFVPAAASAAAHVMARLHAGAALGDVSSTERGGSGSSSGNGGGRALGSPSGSGAPGSPPVGANRRPVDPDDKAEAGLRLPTAESVTIKLYALLLAVALIVYVAVRLWDVIEVHQLESDSWRLVYRLAVIAVEAAAGYTAVASVVSRMRRLRLEALAPEARERPFVIDDAITILVATDEDAATITESVASHYAASRPAGVPARVVILAERPTDAVRAAHASAAAAHEGVLLFTNEDLARQEYVLTAPGADAAAALNVVLEEGMYLGQALFYALDRLFLQYGHAITNAAITVMPASSVVDSEKYYPWVASHLERPGISCVSTPTVARNRAAAADVLDATRHMHEAVWLSAAAGEHRFAVNAAAFTARGYSLWRVLRRMEMENVDSGELAWLAYAMHIEARQAAVATMTVHAPRTSVLAPTHTPTALSRTLERQAETYDVACIFNRETPFLSWDLINPLRAPHQAARAAVLLEGTAAAVALVTALGGIAPWSTTERLVAGAFLAYYGLVCLSALATPFSTLSPTILAAATLRNRILAPAFAWLYFLNLSRFSVDRRGHFRAVGETTTADLVTYKDRQRAEAEEAKQKAALGAQREREKAAAEAADKRDAAAKARGDAKARQSEVKARQAEARAEAKAAEAAKREKERLRRARRGPGVAIAEGAELGSAGGAAPHSASLIEVPSRAGPVAEGIFRARPDPTAAYDGVAGAAPAGAAPPPSRPRRGLLGGYKKPRARAAAAVAPVPRFKTPAATARGRTGAGDAHRPHRGLKLMSIPLAVVLLVAGGVSIWQAFSRLAGPDAPENYTFVEILCARSWFLSAALIGVLLFTAALVYLSFLTRTDAVLANRVAIALVAALSAACLAGIGALPFLSAAVLETRNGVYDTDALHAASMRFVAGAAAGAPLAGLAPAWRASAGALGGAATHAGSGASLAGGWFTGPGSLKVTYPQAHAMTDISLASIAFFEQLRAMPSGGGAGRTAADDVRDVLRHGAEHLLATYDSGTGAVAAVVDGGTVGYVDAAQPGAETAAALTAAFAAMSVAVVPYEESDELPARLRSAAVGTFALTRAWNGSYAAVFPDVAAAWPSDGAALDDDKLLAAGLMLYAFSGEPEYRNAVNLYYTRAQQARAAAGALADYRLAPDDHWWPANVFLAQADGLSSRYAEAVERFVRAWLGEPTEVPFPPPAGTLADAGGLRLETPPNWGASQQAFASPGPLGMTARAMGYAVIWAASRDREGPFERRVSCYAQGQLRNMMGLNDGKQSYFVGVAPDGAAGVRAPSTGGVTPQGAVPEGALVNGPGPGYAFADNGDARTSGTGLGNNAPLTLLAAGLRSRQLLIEDCIGLKPREPLRQITVESRTEQASSLSALTG